jgi:hypothetical protein
MKLFAADNFLTKGSAQLPSGDFRGIAIDSSSEVDVVEIGGRVLGVNQVVPFQGDVRSVRYPGDALNTGQATYGAVVGGDAGPTGEVLTLKLYEACDALVPPGPRAPVFRRAKFADTQMTATVTNAKLAFRLPFHGRRMACLSMWRSDSTRDFNLLVVGARYGRKGSVQFSDYVESGPFAWWNGAALPASSMDSTNLQNQSRVFYVGGEGDNVEGFDELFVYAYGASAAGSNYCVVTGEAFGERNG